MKDGWFLNIIKYSIVKSTIDPFSNPNYAFITPLYYVAVERYKNKIKNMIIIKLDKIM